MREYDMMLIENRNFLRIQHRSLLDEIAEWENKTPQTVEVEASRKGEPTVKIFSDGKPLYIHSKYDPKSEADKLVGKLENLKKYNHILFIGTGLGYHIQELLSRYPEMNYSIYEPNKEMVYQFLANFNTSDFPKAELKKIIVTKDTSQLQKEVAQLHQTMDMKTFVFILPSCAKLYDNEHKVILDSLKETLKGKQTGLATNFSLQKRWTINSIKNFPQLLKTPNILHDIDKKTFKDKPAILVAAGPSLSEEFENLRKIKEDGSAYIFSVGSAINALIEQNIYPDAACTYDPNEINQRVFEKVKEKGISEIPLIFGSSVGFETLQGYQGPMLHMITSQDTVSPSLIANSDKLQKVIDAPSIAVLTFQLLKMLECRQIVLVGQNFAYTGNKRYAEGIQYEGVTKELTEKDQKIIEMVKDVYGGTVQSRDSFIRGRKQMESYIQHSPEIKVWNTTKGGAHIEGTEFIPLLEIIETVLTESKIVKENWFEQTNRYDKDHIQQRIDKLNSEEQLIIKTVANCIQELKQIDRDISLNQLRDIEKHFKRFDKEFKKLTSNLFYKTFVESMMRVHVQKLSEEMPKVRFEKDKMKKAKVVRQLFGSFIIDCQQHIQFVTPFFKELQHNLDELEQQVSQ